MENGEEVPALNTSQRDEISLICSVLQGDLDTVRSMLSRGHVQVDAAFYTGKTALYHACAGGHHEIAELLLDMGASIDNAATNALGFRAGQKSHTALHVAAKMGKLEVVKLLLRRGADVHLLGNGSTPLHLACENGHCQAAALLLDHGSVINATYKLKYSEPYYNGGTALILAAESGSEETVKLLLSRNADIEAVDLSGANALHASCYKKRREVAELLVKSGASTSHFDTAGNTALHYASWNGMEETVKLLLNCGADVNASVHNGMTPLHFACLAKFPNVAECLIKNGARVNVALGTSSDEGVRGFSPLHFAADRKNLTAGVDIQIALIALLFDWGADVNSVDENARTPLIIFLDWSTGHNREKAIAEVFAKHLMKMKFSNLFVSAPNLRELSSHVMLNVFSQYCKSEIESMQRKCIGDSNVTFFDVFTKGRIRLADYMANESVAKVAESADFEMEFPIYARCIRKNFNQGRERRDLQRDSYSVLSLSRFRYVPYLCMRKLNGYLNNEDLECVIKAKQNRN